MNTSILALSTAFFTNGGNLLGFFTISAIQGFASGAVNTGEQMLHLKKSLRF